MKKLNFLLMCLFALSLTFVSCDPKDDGPDVDEIVEDGFYVVGEATSSVKLVNTGIMSAGKNEVDQSTREGMYEKYIALEGGKPFHLLLKKGTVETKYGATLTDVDLKGESDQPNIVVKKGQLTENATLQVAESGLYHIVLDLNVNSDLEFPQIVIAPVSWGMRGGFNSWGFTELTPSAFNKDSMTFTLEGVEIKSTQEFKFAYGAGWKIQLDAEGLVKSNTNLGKDMIPGGDNFKVEENGVYKVTLTWKLVQGTINESYKVKFEKTGELTASYPTNLYMIGTDFGNWTWTDAGVAELAPVNGVDGAFWCIRYFTAANGFKWAPGKEWKDDFTGLTTNTGYTITDGNAFVPADGIYMVYVDMKEGKVAIDPAAVYGIGDVFGGWDQAVEANKFSVSADGKKLTYTVANAGNLRMYAGSSIATTDWWTREFNVIDGKIEYRGNGGDQAAVPVTAGKVVTLDFNAGTGTIE